MLSDSSEILKGELDRSETLLWSGQPRQGIFLKPGDVSSIVLGLLWLGGAIYWEVVNVYTHADSSSILFGVFPILGGLFVVLGRFLVDASERQKIYYGLTNERIILLQQEATMLGRSIPLATLCEVTAITDITGFGTLTFGFDDLNKRNPNAGSTWPIMGRIIPLKLDTIADAKNVSEMIRSAQHEAHKRTIPHSLESFSHAE